MSSPPPGLPPPGPPRDRPNLKGAPAKPPDKVWNFVGLWNVIRTGRPPTPVPSEGFIAFTPQYEARRRELERLDNSGVAIPGRVAKCLPSGLPDMMTFGFNVFANAEYMTVIGGYGTVQVIWLDRKEHTPAPKLFPSYGGESIAHWEGDTLIVDVVGLDPTNEIVYALPADDPDLHIVERWKLLDKNTLQVVIIVDSKLALTRPWAYTMVYGRRPSSDLINGVMYCDRPLVNNNSLDLTPPIGGYIPPGADK